MSEDEITQDELDAQSGEPLPDREATSVVTGGTGPAASLAADSAAMVHPMAPDSGGVAPPISHDTVTGDGVVERGAPPDVAPADESPR